MTSQRVLILEALVTRLRDIRTRDTAASGATYETDAGLAVYVGERPELGESDPYVAIAVLPQEDDVAGIGQQLAFMVTLPIAIEAIASVDRLDEPYLAAEAVVADIKRAIEGERTLGGLVSDMRRGSTAVVPREPGTTTVGVAVTYQLTFKEPWGNP